MSDSDTKFRGIPIVESGRKYQTDAGFTAIKNGVKQRRDAAPVVHGQKPKWLRAKMPSGVGYSQTRDIVHEHRLSTVCEESMCPNIGECWNAGTATIMVLGSVCTRACRFCAVDTGNPKGWLDPDEPANTGRAVRLMGLDYVVITSVDRDDLEDGGASHYAECVREIKERNPGTAVEALTPDFNGVRAHVEVVVDSGLDVFAQNVETVKRLTHPVRDPRAGYEQTLDVLRRARNAGEHVGKICEHIEREAGQIDVVARQGEEMLHRESFPLEVLAHNEWNGVTSLPELLAAFVQPNHPANVARQTYVEVDGMVQPAPAPRFSETLNDHPQSGVAPGTHSRAVLAANHLSHLDPPIVTLAAPHNVRYLALDELFGITLGDSIFCPGICPGNRYQVVLWRM